MKDRCEYCEYRNGWECGDGFRRISNDTLCEYFKLDFDTLSDGVKEQIQKRLIGKLEWI